MDTHDSLALRLTDNLNALGVDDRVLVQVCQALEEVRRLNRNEHNAPTDQEIEWSHFRRDQRKNMRRVLTRWGLITNGLLQLPSEEELNDLPEIAGRRLSYARSYLIARGCGFRPSNVPFASRACELYGNMESVPVEVLLFRLYNHESALIRADFVVRRLREDGAETLGDLRARSRAFSALSSLLGSSEVARWLRGWLAGMF